MFSYRAKGLIHFTSSYPIISTHFESPPHLILGTPSSTFLAGVRLQFCYPLPILHDLIIAISGGTYTVHINPAATSVTGSDCRTAGGITEEPTRQFDWPACHTFTSPLTFTYAPQHCMYNEQIHSPIMSTFALPPCLHTPTFYVQWTGTFTNNVNFRIAAMFAHTDIACTMNRYIHQQSPAKCRMHKYNRSPVTDMKLKALENTRTLRCHRNFNLFLCLLPALLKA
jgi:hypothetical protein